MLGKFVTRRVALGVAGLAATVAPLATSLGPTAHAATAHHCVLNGKTTSLTPIPAPPATGGSGSFTFTGSGNCVGPDGLRSGSLSASGSYSNIVCGTGTATGTASTPIGTFGFKITFANGAGVLQITSGGTGGGSVDIAPSNIGGCVTTAVTGFTVAADVTVAQ
jgi:hypothetical protein